MTMNWIPDSVKQQIFDSLVEFLGKQLDKYGDQAISQVFTSLSSKRQMQHELDQALQRAVERFQHEYVDIDPDLITALITTPSIWENQEVTQALFRLIKRPGAWQGRDREVVLDHFASLLPQRQDRER